jgi:hypothetical protein
MPLTRDQILKTVDFTIETVDVPGYGPINIRSWDGAARDVYDNLLTRLSVPGTDAEGRPVMRLNDVRTIKATMLCLSLCDDTGARLFNPADANDIKAMDARGLDFIDTLITRIRALAKLNQADAEAAEKKSDPSTASIS